MKQFYDERRGDIVLNPLDARMPYWNPSKELRRKAEAKALAVSLYQPEGVTNRFFVEAPQKIFAHLLTYLPDAGGTGASGCPILPRSTAASKEPSIGC